MKIAYLVMSFIGLLFFSSILAAAELKELGEEDLAFLESVKLPDGKPDEQLGSYLMRLQSELFQKENTKCSLQIHADLTEIEMLRRILNRSVVDVFATLRPNDGFEVNPEINLWKMIRYVESETFMVLKRDPNEAKSFVIGSNPNKKIPHK